ncbi:MAG: glucose-1-phosphate cytidylyltransferase [Prosthecobacter sp.]|uniref:glucose-1-phosphate cytidylyltransferase n=1 Tax=Prosthecobacter sp. TaxID=1965333 RepID=UPI0038FFD5CE
MKVVILCGGKGTRLREETEYRPKPMVPIGGRPILWHIMKYYASQGHREFILCLGYKGEMIKDYFRNYLWNAGDVTLSLGKGAPPVFHDKHGEEDWTVTLAETGEESMTAWRVRQIEKHLGGDEHFLLTYGDGVGSIDIASTIKTHLEQQAVCTLTGVHPPGRFGELRIDQGARVVAFNEKPQAEGGYINGGYMVCSRELFRYLPDDPAMMLERAPMDDMIRDGKLAVCAHDGFWQPMDTYQEFQLLNRLWHEGNAPWKIW